MDQHELICALKDLAIELGRTPTRDEFVSRIRQRKAIDDFGGWAVLIQAAGLDPLPKSRIKIPNTVFERSIEKHLEEYEPRERQAVSKPRRTAIISDIHWPFHAQRVVDRFFRWVDDEKPEIVILAGDAMDMYSHAKFPRSHNVFTPKDEEAMAKKHNADFWAQIKKSAPAARCVQMLGNHDVRPMKRALEAVPTMEHWIKSYLTDLFKFEGVETIMDPRQELMLPGDIMVHHGHLSKLGDHRDHALYNAIVGHTHRAGVVFREIRGRTLFEMNCGYAGDPNAKGLTYTPQRITGWTQGFGAVDEDGPRVIIC